MPILSRDAPGAAYPPVFSATLEAITALLGNGSTNCPRLFSLRRLLAFLLEASFAADTSTLRIGAFRFGFTLSLRERKRALRRETHR